MYVYKVGDRFHTGYPDGQSEFHEVVAVEKELFFAVPVRQTQNNEIVKDYSLVKAYSQDGAGGYYPIEKIISYTSQ